jgi:hypothetical protein
MQTIVLKWDIGKSCAGIQSLCHNETNVRSGFHEQLATSSWQESMVSQIDKSQL